MPLIDAFHLATEPAILTFRDGDDQRHWSKRRLDHAVPVAHDLDLCLGGHGNSQQRKSGSCSDPACQTTSFSSFGDGSLPRGLGASFAAARPEMPHVRCQVSPDEVLVRVLRRCRVGAQRATG